MKKLILLICLFVQAQLLFSQRIVLKVEDIHGVKDSVIFGYNQSATIGLDSHLEEANLFQSSSQNGVYSIQRDSFSYYQCSDDQIDFDRDYYMQNFDSKVNFRNYSNLENESTFEFRIELDSLVSIKFISEQINIGTGTYYITENDTCTAVPSMAIVPGNELYEYEALSEFHEIPSMITKLKIKLVDDFITSIEERNISDLNIFPNPTTGSIFIQSENEGIESIEIYNCLGRIIFWKGFISPIKKFQINELENFYGHLFIKIKLENGYEMFKKVVKL